MAWQSCPSKANGAPDECLITLHFLRESNDLQPQGLKDRLRKTEVHQNCSPRS